MSVFNKRTLEKEFTFEEKMKILNQVSLHIYKKQYDELDTDEKEICWIELEGDLK